MFIAVPVTDDGLVDPRWGRARSVAIAEVDENDKLVSWKCHVVRWDELHDEGTHGQHHGRIIRFLRENAVQAVLVGHMGPGIAHSIDKLGVLIGAGACGDARTLVQVVAPQLREELAQRSALGEASTYADGLGASTTPDRGERKNLLG